MKKRIKFFSALLAVTLAMLLLPCKASAVVVVADTDPLVTRVANTINNERIARGLVPLEVTADLSGCASIRAIDISYRFSHARRDGSPWYSVRPDIQFGETIGRETIGRDFYATDIASFWLRNPSHSSVLLYPSFRTIGLGYRVGSDGLRYWTAEFGY